MQQKFGTGQTTDLTLQLQPDPYGARATVHQWLPERT